MEPENCAICGQPGDDWHHLTGRGADDLQLDPEVTAPLCHDDHELIHGDLRAEHVDKPLAAITIVERVAHRLRRVGVFLVRVAEAVPPLRWLARLAAGMRQWADELTGHVRALDAWNPSWRLAQGTT